MRKVIDREGSHNPLPYSAGVISSGRLLFMAGQGPFDVATGERVEGSFDDQVRLTFENMKAVAAAAGTDLSRAVKVNGYLRDMANFPRYNEIYREYFRGDLPARTTVQSDLPGFEVEVEAVLALDD